ncbi:MAG: hypothetical protein IID38_08260 [Planctomycetes bacterium]|nr:hypothetical protein [Planctomycetota bacterium]
MRRLGGIGLLLSAMLVIALLLSLRWCVGIFAPHTMNVGGIPYNGVFVNEANLAFVAVPPLEEWQVVSGRRMPRWRMSWWRPAIDDVFFRARCLPLIYPLLLMAIPSALLWRRHRLTLPGHCSQCSYNLTGNVSGVCPECGTPV